MRKLNKSIILIVSFLIISVGSYAQTLDLSYEGQALGDTLLMATDISTPEMVVEIVVTNNTDHNVDVKVLRTELDIVEGTVNYFCWAGNCFPPYVDESSTFISLAPGEATEESAFSGHYDINEFYGDSFIEYKFFNTNDYSEYGKVIVQYAATMVGIEEKEEIHANVFPNPASEHLTIQLSQTINTLIVYNYLGLKLIEENVNASSYKMNISNLSSGIYLLHIATDRGTVVKQIVVE